MTSAPVLVTGATGFLGGAVLRHLHVAGICAVGHGRSEEKAAPLLDAGLRMELGDLAERSEAERLFARTGARSVVHCAALSAPFGPRRAFERANVDATRGLLHAAAAANVARFVHISSPSVYAAGRPLHSVAEDEPLPLQGINSYADTKRRAEELVLAASGRGLSTVTLRPRALFGPGDTALFPRLIRAMKEGGLPIIGGGDNRIDLTYIDNAVQAVHLALDAPAELSGRTYNVTNGEPTRLWDLLSKVAVHEGLPPPERRVPRPVARVAAGFAEGIHRLLRRPGEPRLTRYSVDSLSLDATLDISRAREELGYAPTVTVEEGVERFLAGLDTGEPDGR